MLLLLPPQLYQISLFPVIKRSPVAELCSKLDGSTRNHKEIGQMDRAIQTTL